MTKTLKITRCDADRTTSVYGAPSRYAGRSVRPHLGLIFRPCQGARTDYEASPAFDHRFGDARPSATFATEAEAIAYLAERA